MAETVVTVPLYFTGEPGWLGAETSIVAGNSVVIVGIEERSANHLHVCTYDKATESREVKLLISRGMVAAHQQAKAHMVETFGEDWKQRAEYRFGKLAYSQLTEMEDLES